MKIILFIKSKSLHKHPLFLSKTSCRITIYSTNLLKVAIRATSSPTLSSAWWPTRQKSRSFLSFMCSTTSWWLPVPQLTLITSLIFSLRMILPFLKCNFCLINFNIYLKHSVRSKPAISDKFFGVP